MNEPKQLCSECREHHAVSTSGKMRGHKRSAGHKLGGGGLCKERCAGSFQWPLSGDALREHENRQADSLKRWAESQEYIKPLIGFRAPDGRAVRSCNVLECVNPLLGIVEVGSTGHATVFGLCREHAKALLVEIAVRCGPSDP